MPSPDTSSLLARLEREDRGRYRLGIVTLITRRDPVFGLRCVEIRGELFELAAQAARIRERSVVDEAPVLASRVGMSILWGYRGLRRHTRVADKVSSTHAGKAIPIGHLGR